MSYSCLVKDGNTITLKVELVNFDRDLLLNQNLSSQFEKKILSLGGTSLSNAINKIMPTIITDELCRQLTWYGFHGTLAVKDLHFPSIIISATRKKIASTVTDVQERIKDWLRRPSDRQKKKRGVNQQPIL
ncbi:uncharacterized protein LOC111643387 [Copidosoma floridanum]|uniref:uncharacterized protein LOC111643387 n=1 Tax=Copidosoma floridanum TaxID=29053 RepID=UPI000C6F93D8|nr:uncharacterized protein LOC111643387 [Copidosoma floridanum]